jgi:hypothetical protein
MAAAFEKELFDTKSLISDTISTVAVAANASESGLGNLHNKNPRLISVPLDTCSTNRTNVEIDYVALYGLANETSTRLTVFSERASEGKDLHAANEFCAYLEWSGILKMLEAASRPEPLKIDGSFIRWKQQELLRLVRAQFKSNAKTISLELSQLEAVNHKLDLIAAHVAKLWPPKCETTAAESPALHVITGGAVSTSAQG